MLTGRPAWAERVLDQRWDGAVLGDEVGELVEHDGERGVALFAQPEQRVDRLSPVGEGHRVGGAGEPGEGGGQIGEVLGVGLLDAGDHEPADCFTE